MDERLCMNILNSRDKLIRQQQDGLQGELPVAKIEEIFKTGPEEIQHHGIIVTLRSKPADERDSNTSCQGFVDTGFILQLWMLGLYAFQFDGYLLSRYDIGTCKLVSTCMSLLEERHTKVDIPKTTAANLTANSVFIAHTKILCTPSQPPVHPQALFKVY